MSELTTIKEYQGPRPWLRVRIIRRGDTKFVVVMSRVHVNKERQLSHCYSTTFSDSDIMNDIDFRPWL